MPRKSRKKSETGIYHIMLRGINKQIIFTDEEDNFKFLKVLNDCKKISGFQLYAYCLMENHLHLLLKVEKEELEQIFKRIGVRFVYWYNQKYERTGHLFQDRFKSEPINDETYFLTVLYYIHQNPIKAGVCKEPEEYEWSSYKEYLGDKGIIDKEYALTIFGENKDKALKNFMKQTKEIQAQSNLENAQYGQRLTEKEALKRICDLCKVKSPLELQKMNINERDKNIALLKHNGLSIRQISRLTGISFGIVRK